MADQRAWWADELEKLQQSLGSGSDGLSAEEAQRRMASARPRKAGHSALKLFASQFANPLVLILIFGALLSLVLKEWVDATIILVIIAGSGLLGFTQEYRASQAIAELRSRLVRQVRLMRGGQEVTVPVSEVVPGDVALLRTGDLVPGDGRLIEGKALLVDEAVLTGEAFPVEKVPGTAPADAPIARRTGALFEGTSIRSGTCRMLVVRTGKDTLFGAIEQDLEKAEETTEFARGLARFGSMLMRVMLIVVLLVLAASLAFGRDLMGALLFAMALAVAISPQLLPAIVSVTLAAGARRMTLHGVLVRRLESIENLGGMDILCTDKTGTLTKGAIALSAAVGPDGASSAQVLRLAAINATFQTEMQSALDDAILSAATATSLELENVKRLGDMPYDFKHRCFSVEVSETGGPARIITKGAVNEVLGDCMTIRQGTDAVPLDEAARKATQDFLCEKAGQGFRTLALATGARGQACLEGFLLFFDPLKPGIQRTLAALRKRGISVRIISGDNVHVSAHVAHQVGLPEGAPLTGDQIDAMDDAALAARVAGTYVFAEVEPQQKGRIIRAFQSAGHAVGYMGDGINDAPALRAADVGISVDTAADVARESADIVLLHPDLNAIRLGVEDGRRTFANTLKYIAIKISANFGNMVSMALATVLLPFLPMLPVQILLNNFLSDFPAIAIAGDTVDPERLAHAQRWDIGRIRAFMILFGLVSTVFDLVTFAWLRLILHADVATFRTAWFVESLLTQLIVLFVLRTRRRFWRSRPAPLLLWSSIFVAILALALPVSGPIGAVFAFEPLSLGLVAALLVIVLVYAGVTELAKGRGKLMDR